MCQTNLRGEMRSINMAESMGRQPGGTADTEQLRFIVALSRAMRLSSSEVDALRPTFKAVMDVEYVYFEHLFVGSETTEGPCISLFDV